MPLNKEIVRTWDRHGGTRLGTSVSNSFDPKKDQSELVIENAKKLGLDAIVVISRMVAWKQGEVATVPIKKALEQLNLVNVEKFYNTKDYRSRDQVL